MISAGFLAAGLIASERNAALRSFMIVWIAFLVTSAGLHVFLDASGLTGWTDRTPKYRWVLVVSSMILIPSLAILATARALALDRSELHLRRGDMSAPGLIPGTRRYESWKWIGLASATVFLVGGAIWVASTARSSSSEFALVMTWLPAGLLFAAVNAAQEELRFRLVPLATLAPAVGDESAIWMTSAIFGLAHWSEATPSGPIGFVFHGLVGALLAKSILETRGVAWAWMIHAVGNFVLFIALVLDAN